MSLLFPPNIPELKVRIRTAIETITSDRPQTWNEFNYCVHICRITNGAPVRYVTKSWSVFLLNKKKIHILLSEMYCVWQDVKTPTFISNNPV
jgi:hypothetical protein